MRANDVTNIKNGIAKDLVFIAMPFFAKIMSPIPIVLSCQRPAQCYNREKI